MQRRNHSNPQSDSGPKKDSGPKDHSGPQSHIVTIVTIAAANQHVGEFL